MQRVVLDLHSAIVSQWTVGKKGVTGPQPVSSSLFDGSFTFEAAHLKTSRGQPTTAWDEALQHYKLQVTDGSDSRLVLRPCCPSC
jgi:hypothetical protein